MKVKRHIFSTMTINIQHDKQKLHWSISDLQVFWSNYYKLKNNIYYLILSNIIIYKKY